MKTEETVKRQNRYTEIDAFRGIAILMMIIYHLLYDLSFFNIVPIEVHTGFWRVFAFITAISFVFIAGLSLSISHARASAVLKGAAMYAKYLKRGLEILGIGMLITLCTWLYLGDGYILFGILHLIGLSIIIAPFFFRFKWFNLIAGAIVVSAGFLVTRVSGPLWLAWIGIHPASFYSVDYEPLLPWFGFILFGLFTGSILYPDGIRKIRVPDMDNCAAATLAFAGRHSLLIYLIHQPVIIIILAAVTGIPII